MNENKTSSIAVQVYKLVSGRRKWLILAGVIIVPAAAVMLLASNEGSAPAGQKMINTFRVRRDNLKITVTESGSIKARKSIDLKSEVEGRATIINIVPEGSVITPEDVNNGRVLVELDSGDLKEQLTQRQIDFTTVEAAYAEAKEAYDIQVKQNESDVSAAELKVKFALMDFQKHLGEELAARLIKVVNDANDANNDIADLIELNGLLNEPNGLGGECSQKLNELKDNILLAEEQLKRAQNDLDWTIRLREKEYVSETDLQSDRLNVESLEIKLGQAKTYLNLYMAYDFSKTTQKLLSDYYESRRNLERTYAKARSQLAQARARLESAKAKLDLQQERLNKTQKQFAACTIKAPAPGLVVYGSSQDPFRRFGGGSSSGMIAAGEQVFLQQVIITLPDTSEMMAEITVHESSVDKVKPGQKATIVMDAFPDKTFDGEVIKVAPLPDQQRGWLTPDVKVYTTQVGIKGKHDFLKPGMSARVEILIEDLADVLMAPVQVVANRGGKKVCFVASGAKIEEREVRTGLFNDTSVQILEGLKEGEDVLLNPPRITETRQEPTRRLAGEFKTQGAGRGTQNEGRGMRDEGRGAKDDGRMTRDEGRAMSEGAAIPEPNRGGRMRRGGMQAFGGPGPFGGPGGNFDFNQLDDETKARIKEFREKMQRGEISLDPNQMDEEAKERFRQLRNRMREQGVDSTNPTTSGADGRQEP